MTRFSRYVQTNGPRQEGNNNRPTGGARELAFCGRIDLSPRPYTWNLFVRV